MVTKDETATKPGQETPQEGEQGTSEKPEEKTLTKAEAEELVKKGRSDALAEAGRSSKDLKDKADKLQKDTKDFEDRKANDQRDRDEEEQTRLKDDPSGLKALRDRQEVRRKQETQERKGREQEATDASLKAREDAIGGEVAKSLAAKLSQELKVSPADLLKFSDGSESSMREVAPRLVTVEPGEGAKKTTTADSGKTTGADPSGADKLKTRYPSMH